jgi:hypothetical protein
VRPCWAHQEKTPAMSPQRGFWSFKLSSWL